jgi:hypothetical protein
MSTPAASSKTTDAGYGKGGDGFAVSPLYGR